MNDSHTLVVRLGSHTLSPAERDIVRDATVLFSYGHSLPAELTAALLDIIDRAAA